MPRPVRFSDELNKMLVASVYWDFAVDGGAIGAITLPGVLPAGAIILGGTVNVITTCTSAGADAGTGALSIQSANDLVSAIAISNGANPWDAGQHDIVPDATGSTGIKLTADRNVTFTIATQNFTAGKLAVHLWYIMGPDLDFDES